MKDIQHFPFSLMFSLYLVLLSEVRNIIQSIRLVYLISCLEYDHLDFDLF